MPIIRITQEIDPRSVAAWPLLGVLRKGAPKEKKTKNGQEIEVWGKELPYFRVDFTNPHATPEWVEAWRELYGDQPQVIPGVRLAGNTLDEVFPFWMKEYAGNKVAIRVCDGQQQVKYWTPEGYRTDPLPCIAPDCNCAMVGQLVIWLPDFSRAIGMPGKLFVKTGSQIDMKHLYGYLGGLAANGVPLGQAAFVLSREPGEIVQPVKGKPSRITKHFVRIMLDPAYVKLLQVPSAPQLEAGGQPPERPAPAGEAAVEAEYEEDEVPPSRAGRRQPPDPGPAKLDAGSPAKLDAGSPAEPDAGGNGHRNVQPPPQKTRTAPPANGGPAELDAGGPAELDAGSAWTANAARVQRFREWGYGQGLTNTDLCAALSEDEAQRAGHAARVIVYDDRIEGYTGSPEEARAAVDAYVERRLERPATAGQKTLLAEEQENA